MNNQWSVYGPQPGMGYNVQPQQCAYMGPPYNQDEENNKIIKQTALCCTVAVLVGVGVGIMIESNRHKSEEDRIKSAFLLN